MYVCMYVCLYVCMSVCNLNTDDNNYVCMYLLYKPYFNLNIACQITYV